MFNKERIKTEVLLLAATIPDFDANETELDFAIRRTIQKAISLRNCSEEELQAEKRDYTDVLISMVLSYVQLKGKLGRVRDSENNVVRFFESGGRYELEDLREFIPLLRVPR